MNDRLIFFLRQALKLVLKTFSFVLLRVLDEVKQRAMAVLTSNTEVTIVKSDSSDGAGKRNTAKWRCKTS